MKNLYNLSKQEVFEKYSTSSSGLSTEQAKIKLEENGLNKLKEPKKKNIFQKFLSQFKDVLILILLISAVVSIFLNEVIDSVIILVVVLINAIIGIIQENKAENAMQSLKNLTRPYAKVIRNGVTEKILSEEIVIGDIVVLEAGDFVPADLRLIETASLKIEESSLTGESVAVEKSCDIIEKTELALGDQHNLAFMGTSVTYGRGIGVVVNTGSNTEMGKIASSLTEHKEEKTLLQKRVDKTSKILSIVVLILAVVIFAVGLIRNPNDFVGCFMIAVSIAVCAVPEGLPTGLTVAMSIGVANMSKRKAIVKKLSSVETLGSTQIICSDKTGTLTLNKMTVKQVFVLNENEYQLEQNPNFAELINAMVLCNDTQSKLDGDHLSTIGDPTETALVHYAQTFGFNKEKLNGMFPRVNEIPFDSERKLMTTINSVNGKNIAYVKGATDNLLNKCTKILDNGKIREINEQDRILIEQKMQELMENALRVLGYACKEIHGDVYNIEADNIENDLVFIGLSGMIDPPREEVKPAIDTCKKAGIKVIMITGDHKDTAFAIAKDIGIAENKNQVLTGMEINDLTDQELTKKIEQVSVFARVNPEHKVRIVKALKQRDFIVAMTGDGVNDAPSIKQADIGIGMGITGTDVTKDVADIILTDDNFATIVSAVEEGRIIYSNVLKIIIFLLSTCVAEIVLMFTVITILGLDLFSAPVILWINVISDTFPALALGMERAERGIMDKKPNKNRGSLFSGLNGLNILLVGIIQGLLLLGLFLVAHYAIGLPNNVVSTMCFVSLIAIELFHSFNIRDLHNSLFSQNPFSNKYLNGATIISALLSIAFLTLMPVNILNAIGLTTLSITQWLICIAISALIIPIYELFKIFVRKFNK